MMKVFSTIAGHYIKEKKKKTTQNKQERQWLYLTKLFRRGDILMH